MWMTYKSWSLPAEVLNQQIDKKPLTNELEQLHLTYVLGKHIM